ncbi:MAG: NADH-quinone oxidoreductase subunit L [Acidobacteria bacterium]|nr:NADH-quinone oxidoreductase subunit L [Acidobacteriota bacterium]
MFHLLWLIPAIPFASAVTLAVAGSWMARRAVSILGVCSIAASALISILITGAFLNAPPLTGRYVQHLWTWIDVAGFRPDVSLYLDTLSLVMVLTVTFVSFIVHLYSTEFMEGDPGYARFFAYMNLFVASMVTLLLASNLLLLYLAWEGVGVCSYLLIGFWYTDPANGRAARKAFIVTRVGDTALAIALFVIFTQLGTLDIQVAMRRAPLVWPIGSAYAVAAALLLLGGAVGKSAQLPLQTWLPDSMAGPTPTSALIHAATMVTAGVYLIARTHVLFTIAPPAQFAVAIVGAASMLLAGFSALTQRDIKRVLAYSTISQVGYMFLALGVSAWVAAIFHFMTHAFFKALLFMAAGAVIQALDGEHNILNMGGLRRELPIAFWAFLAGGSALAGLPLVTAGFYSKDLIVWQAAWGAPTGGPGLWAIGVGGIVLTSMYSYRLIFLVFFGRARKHVVKRPRLAMKISLGVLTLLSLCAGFVNIPPQLGNVPVFTDLLLLSLPPTLGKVRAPITETQSEIASGFAFMVGLCVVYWFFVRARGDAEAVTASGVGESLRRFWQSGWGFDWLYERVFVRPVVWAASVNRNDFMDAFYNGAAALTRLCYRALSWTESGRLRWYAAGIAGGAVIFIAIALFA